MAEINTKPTKVYVVIITRHHVGCGKSSCIRDCLEKVGVFYSKEDAEKFEDEEAEESDCDNVANSYVKEVEIK